MNGPKVEKDQVEKLLNPMKTLPRMWEVWNELVNTTENRSALAAFNLLENEGKDYKLPPNEAYTLSV